MLFEEFSLYQKLLPRISQSASMSCVRAAAPTIDCEGKLAKQLHILTFSTEHQHRPVPFISRSIAASCLYLYTPLQHLTVWKTIEQAPCCLRDKAAA